MLKNAVALLWSISSAGIKWSLTLCVRKAIHSINSFHYTSFRFVSVFSLPLAFRYCVKLAWQQMTANEQNDFRIVNVNLYAIKNNFALNQLWLFWIDRHCCAELLLLLILLLVSFIAVAALVPLSSLLHVPFLRNSIKWFGVSFSVQANTTKVSKTMRKEHNNNTRVMQMK